MYLIMAVKGALKLVIKGRGLCYYYLNVRLCRMVELFLMLRGKLSAIDDQEIQSLMLNDWDLYTFVKELIQAIISSIKFGAYGRCNEEIKVYRYIAIYTNSIGHSHVLTFSRIKTVNLLHLENMLKGAN